MALQTQSAQPMKNKTVVLKALRQARPKVSHEASYLLRIIHDSKTLAQATFFTRDALMKTFEYDARFIRLSTASRYQKLCQLVIELIASGDLRQVLARNRIFLCLASKHNEALAYLGNDETVYTDRHATTIEAIVGRAKDKPVHIAKVMEQWQKEETAASIVDSDRRVFVVHVIRQMASAGLLEENEDDYTFNYKKPK